MKNFYQKWGNQTPLLEDFFEKQKIWEKNSGENSNQNNYSPEKDFEIFSIDSMEFDEKSENSEEKFLQQMIEKFGKLHIVTHNKKTLEILEKILAKKQISTTLRHEFYQFIAGTEIWTSAKNIQKIERKYFIFLIKMLFWLVETKTGRVNELKYYGNEFEWLENFRLQANECNYFLEEHEKNLENSEVILEVYTQNIQKNPNRKMILRDVMLLEGAIRKNFSSEVHFEKLIENIKNCKNPYQNELIEVLRIIEGIYISAPNRPTGENPFPPGKYGEIYFLHQKSVWSEGFKWLSMATKQLFEIEKKFQNHHQPKNRIENILAQKIHDAIIEMMRFNIFENPNLGMILTIQNDATSVQFIEREISQKQQQSFKDTIGYGFSLHEENSQNFVREAFGTLENIQIFDEKKSQITIFEEPKNSLK